MLSTPLRRCAASLPPASRGLAEYLRELKAVLDEEAETAVALVLEPRVAGVAGFVFHPEGYLRGVAELCRARGIWLILDEVMTGFGRTGAMFACQKEGVVPDFLALAKGLTGGYLPMAATLASPEIYEAFLGDTTRAKRSITGTATPRTRSAARRRWRAWRSFAKSGPSRGSASSALLLERLLQPLWEHPPVGDIRVEGMIAAIELVEDFATRRRFAPQARIGARVCEAARAHGLLTRPIGDVHPAHAAVLRHGGATRARGRGHPPGRSAASGHDFAAASRLHLFRSRPEVTDSV